MTAKNNWRVDFEFFERTRKRLAIASVIVAVPIGLFGLAETDEIERDETNFAEVFIFCERRQNFAPSGVARGDAMQKNNSKFRLLDEAVVVAHAHRNWNFEKLMQEVIEHNIIIL